MKEFIDYVINNPDCYYSELYNICGGKNKVDAIRKKLMYHNILISKQYRDARGYPYSHKIIDLQKLKEKYPELY